MNQPMIWIKAVNPLGADLWTRGGGMYVGQEDHSKKPLNHKTIVKRDSEPGHVENHSHGVRKTISYKPMDDYEYSM